MKRCRDSRTRRRERIPPVAARWVAVGAAAPAEAHRTLAAVQRLGEPARVVELPGVLVDEAGQVGVGEPVAVAQGGREVRERLAVRARGGGLAARERGVAADRGTIVGRRGVVHEPGEVGRGFDVQRGDHRPVQRAPAQRRQALLDGLAGQLVAERQPVRPRRHDAALLGLGQRVQPVAEQGVRQVEPDDRGHHRQLLDRGAGVVVEPRHPREHGVGHRDRHPRARLGQRLGDVERVAAGEGVQPLRVPVRPGRQPDHSARAERAQWQPHHPAAHQRAQQPVHRVAGGGRLVAVGEHQHRGQVGDPPREVAQHVERGVVGPVQVFDDDRGDPRPGQLRHHRGEHVAAGAQRGLERASAPRRRVPEGAERARGEEVVTSADEAARAPGHVFGERADQARLPDPRLAADQHHRTAGPASRPHRRCQRIPFVGALQKRGHGPTVAGRIPGGKSD